MNNFENWEQILDKNIQKRIKKLTKQQKIDNFSTNLEFGTAGMRGKMELGTNMVNELTVCKLAESTAKYLLESGLEKKVVICFDTRHNSLLFSRLFAKVLLIHDIDVFLFKDYAPTPLCVYATTKQKASLGVMITASHNSREFNGIKIYNSFGIQIDDITQQKISAIFNSTNEVEVYNNIFKQKPTKKAVYLQKDVIDQFVGEKDYSKKQLKIIYTPLNGTGYYAVKKILNNHGFNFITPKSQKNKDSDFTTCPYPNPEFLPAFNESLVLAQKKDADIILATDPDADRIGVMVKHNGEFIRLTGNEVGYIFAEYLGKTNVKDKFIITSVVSSPLIDKICEQNNIKLYKTLTGFKSLGTLGKQLQEQYSKQAQILLYEESCGYVVNTNYFDKDGIYATLMLCEIAEALKQQNKTLIDYLNAIYEKFGYMETVGDSIVFEGTLSKEKMQQAVNNLRQNKPTKILDEKIVKTVDYLYDNTSLPPQNFIQYIAKNISFIIRPSGTEPKLKIYLFVNGNNKEQTKKRAQEALNDIKNNIIK